MRRVSWRRGTISKPGWLLVVAMCKSGLGLVQAWVEIITVAGLISELPVLERIAPPPSEWGKAGDRVAADPDSERARVRKRIRALLAKAEAPDQAAEAETFTAKAQDLMTRHAIDEALLAAAGDEAVTVGARRVHLQNPYATAKTSLLNAVATANRCKVIYPTDWQLRRLSGSHSISTRSRCSLSPSSSRPLVP